MRTGCMCVGVIGSRTMGEVYAAHAVIQGWCIFFSYT